MADADKSTRKFQKELNAGIVSLILLVMLDRASEPLGRITTRRHEAVARTPHCWTADYT